MAETDFTYSVLQNEDGFYVQLKQLKEIKTPMVNYTISKDIHDDLTKISWIFMLLTQSTKRQSQKQISMLSLMTLQSILHSLRPRQRKKTEKTKLTLQKHPWLRRKGHHMIKSLLCHWRRMAGAYVWCFHLMKLAIPSKLNNFIPLRLEPKMMWEKPTGFILMKKM